MFNQIQQKHLNTLHDIYHITSETISLDQLVQFHRNLDSSCSICYSPCSINSCKPKFHFFWNWQNPSQFNILDQLLNSIRFTHSEIRETLIELINNCSEYTHFFTQHTEILNSLQNQNNYIISDSTNTEHNSSSESESEPQTNTMNQNNQQLINSLQTLSQQLKIRNNILMPTFLEGIQDPVEQLEEFERCATINQYTDEYKLEVVEGYLQNEARVWFI